jgi:hypothetical protein
MGGNDFGAIKQTMAERLEFLPANRQCGFFSDAYCVEGSYGKWQIVRRMMAEVYADEVAGGQYTVDEANSIARAVLFESPQRILGTRPRG